MNPVFFLSRLCLVLSFGATVCPAEPVKVFILAGQSNMLGAGIIDLDKNQNEGKGTLEYLAENDPKYADLRKGRSWVKRDDVNIWSLEGKGKLAPGFGSGADRIGPELGFGNTVGDAIDAPVLLIKISWGGKSLYADFRPPSAGGETGPNYKELVSNVKNVLENLQKEFPKYKDGYELVGFAWHQGWNDGGDMAHVDEYTSNLKYLIQDLRKEWDTPKMLVAIASSGMEGPMKKENRRQILRDNQLKVAEDPEFKETVAGVDTVPFFRPAEESPRNQGYHWNCNAESYYLVGEGLAKAMLRLMESSPPKKQELSYRTFRSADGSKSFEASLVKFNEAAGTVEVIRRNGKQITFELKFLHEDDQAFIKENQ